MGVFRYVICDVFTDQPLAGNALAVFTDAREIDEGRLQPIAREVNFSETVFVYPGTGDGDVRLRIFTPTTELRFAGHPLLGTAFVLAGPLQLETIRLETGMGVIPVHVQREGARIVFGRMEQPVPTWAPYPAVDDLLAALGVDGSKHPVHVYDNGVQHVFVLLGSEREVEDVEPDLGRLAGLPGILGASCSAGSGRSWKTRMFAPAAGVPEDPATGSAAGPLAVHLLRHGLISSGEEIEIAQGSQLNRPSTLYATAWGTPETIDRVEVAGSAVVVARGEFQL